jgi:hypothetical protein
VVARAFVNFAIQVTVNCPVVFKSDQYERANNGIVKKTESCKEDLVGPFVVRGLRTVAKALPG